MRDLQWVVGLFVFGVIVLAWLKTSHPAVLAAGLEWLWARTPAQVLDHVRDSRGRIADALAKGRRWVENDAPKDGPGWLRLVQEWLPPKKATTPGPVQPPVLQEPAPERPPQPAPRPLTCRLFDRPTETGKQRSSVKDVQIQGTLPAPPIRLGFVTSVMDCTDRPEGRVVSSSNHLLREPLSNAYQFRSDGVPVPGGQAWSRVGEIQLQALVAEGPRKLAATLRMIDVDNPPPITDGTSVREHPGLLAEFTLPFSHDFPRAHTEEPNSPQDAAILAAIRLAVAVAAANSRQPDVGAVVLQTYMSTALDTVPNESRPALRTKLETALNQARTDAASGDLSVGPLFDRLAASTADDLPLKYQVADLCFDVLLSHDPVHRKAILILAALADDLKIDPKQFGSMRDGAIKKATSVGMAPEDMELFIGIKKGTPTKAIRETLKAEFKIWNDRMGVLTEGRERDNAQRMIEILNRAVQRRHD